MKKIMIAVTAIVGMAAAVFAECQTCGEAVECPYAYKFKVVVRTTKPVTIKNPGGCGDNICVRKFAVRRLVGFIYGNTETTEIAGKSCNLVKGCACNTWDNAKIIAWDYDTHEAFNIESAELVQLDRIMTSTGGTKKCEVGFKINDLVFSGFGLTGKRDGNITLYSANGCCAGQLPAGHCENCIACGDEVASKVWSICTSENDGPDMEIEKCTAYGKWILRWDDSAVRRLKAGDDIVKAGVWQETTPVDMIKAE